MSQKPSNSDRSPLSAAGACVMVGALVVSAFLMAVAVSSPKHWWLGWVTLLPLFQAVRVLSPLRSASAGALWGASFFAFSIAGSGGTTAATVPTFLLLTGIPAAYTYLGARLTSQVGFSPYLLALGWMGVELALRPLGMRHGLLAASVSDGIAFRVFGSFAGYVLIAFLIAYVNAALLTVISGVCCCSSSTRLIRLSGSGPQRVLACESPIVLSHLIRPAQPRAPPFSI